MFDATDLEIGRRVHLAEMGEDTMTDQSWYNFYAAASEIIIARGWCGQFDSGKPRGLDEDEAEYGFSIDSAYDAWYLGLTVAEYIEAVSADRALKGLRV